MHDWTNVKCPRCGGNIDARVEVESISFKAGDFNKPDVATITFQPHKEYEHKCNKPREVANAT